MKVSKSTAAQWRACQDTYERGEYTDLVTLAAKHGVDYDCLKSRMIRQGWSKRVSDMRSQTSLLVAETILERQKSHLALMVSRYGRFRSEVDRSLEQMQPAADPDALRALVSVEKTADDGVRRALGMRDEVDVTTGGKSIGESIVSALVTLRSQDQSPRLTEEEVGMVVECEVVD